MELNDWIRGRHATGGGRNQAQQSQAQNTHVELLQDMAIQQCNINHVSKEQETIAILNVRAVIGSYIYW